MSDELIERLAADLKPVPRYAMLKFVIAGTLAGVILSSLLMLFWLGTRPNLATAATGAVFWVKFGYTAGLAVLSFNIFLALGRPGGGITWPWAAIAGLLIGLAMAATAQLYWAPIPLRRELIMGSTALLCPFIIVAVSTPVLIAGLAVLRRLAPTRPALAGFAAGLFAGGAGACVYSFHCTESGIPFLLTWYSLGVLAVASLGAVLGRFLLRW